MIIGDVEQLNLENVFARERFDVVLLGDVLEHLRAPDRLLRKLPQVLRPFGCLVVSLPNVAHASVRLALLSGDFTYSDEGLLDRTHLRFFTLRSIVALFREAGYEIRAMRRIRVGFFDTDVRLSIENVALGTLRKLLRDPEASTYQFVLRAEMSEETAARRPAETDGEVFSDRTWSIRTERKKLAQSLMRKGRALLQDKNYREARAWLYRSFMLRPRFRTLRYLIAACVRGPS
jgi:SAM-dependent methyltransferase